MRVLLTRRIPSSALAPLEQQHAVEVHAGPDAIPRTELLARIGGCDALICLLTDRVDHDGATRETRTAMADLAVTNVRRVLAGEPALTPVS